MAIVPPHHADREIHGRLGAGDRCAIAAMMLAPRRRSAAAPRRGPATRWSPLRGDCAALRSPRAHGRTRSTACGRCAQTCGRESEGWARWRAPRPRPCPARHRVLCRPPTGRSRRSQSRPRPGKQNRTHCESRSGRRSITQRRGRTPASRRRFRHAAAAPTSARTRRHAPAARHDRRIRRYVRDPSPGSGGP